VWVARLVRTCCQTFASRLVMAGFHIRTVATLMGHATIQMTLRYAYLSPERERLAIDGLVSHDSVATKSASRGLLGKGDKMQMHNK
jgi:hypothetical protein